MTEHVKKTKGTILGKLNGKAVCLPYETRMNRNIAVYGASGSMKSRAFARIMIFQCVARGNNGGIGESLIITDPKSGARRSRLKRAGTTQMIVRNQFELEN